MPLLAGFVTKFILFQAAAEEGFLWLATVAVIMSTVSLYYYLKVIREMYVARACRGLGRALAALTRWRATASRACCSSVSSWSGIWATPVLEAADDASAVLFG